MSLLNLALSTKTVAQKLAMGTVHTTAMTGNLLYPPATRKPSDADLATAQADLQAAEDDVGTAEAVLKQKIAARKDKEALFDIAITARGMSCESVTPGDRTSLTTTALPLRAAPTPAGPLGAPQNLRVTASEMEGKYDLQ